MDELISRESGRVRWTDGEMTEFLRVWKRDSVMANCYDGHLMTDGVRWTDWKIFPRQVPESLDWSYHLDRWIKMHRQTKSVHEKPEESDWMNDKLNSIGVRWKQMVELCLCVLPRSKKNMYYRYGCSYNTSGVRWCDSAIAESGKTPCRRSGTTSVCC